MSIEIRDGGLSTTVQDTGRFGQYHIGMPPSGAMDGFAHEVANALVGNPEGAATLECTYQGPTVEFRDERVIAVTGPDMSPELNGEAMPTWEAVAVEAGDELAFGFATEGTRTYLAISGGIDVPEIMGSRSTYTLIGLGGHEGRALEAGDSLALGESGDRSDRAGSAVEGSHRPSYGEDDPIRIVMGLCDYRLTEECKRAFLDAEWKVGAEADRVGYRLTDGIDIEFVEREQPFGAGPDPSNVVDLGYPVGSIQVPDEPIVVMRDAVTGGGYATVATVISPDRDRLAQRPTHGTVSFESVTVEEALAAREDQSERLATIRKALE
ncbi:5-oxoprolinase subunit C family protein [Halalkalicoccus jeotgali]|uniref:Urea amidolyase related protein n=1 Tax=Halalkalicoccus jeotgali (strain DSM 18796 / CECT 7217 / JCM 14584 / KCTC 4019 / B3) TaxID=795797 RepID=D8J6G0_HALJB|nr:biotin-dependent carboxyltransferase family protein [Halalkalicoccus jeotgali]ADJ13837.1 urea amidolyase related protein [Halalkalicoccus jeotgali B3]ELY34117.1 urea amidolyase-like protein [Halalkalicoccus jeotgali B3]